MAKTRKHVQIIDDDINIRLYLRTLFQRAGYRVSEVDNPISVTFRDRSNPPDLVVLDLNMPGLDGFGVCRELKKDGAFRAPIVVISGMTEPSHRQAALDAGADAFLSKPIESDALLSRVAGLLGESTGLGPAV